MGILKTFNSIKTRILEAKVKKPAERVVHVYGEMRPGVIKADVAWFDEEGNPMDRPVRTITRGITHKIRPTFNRILAGTSTKDDEQVIDLFILKGV